MTRLVHASLRLATLGWILGVPSCRTKLELPDPNDGNGPPVATTPLPDVPAAQGDQPRADAPAGISRVVDTIDPSRIRQDVDRLAAFGTRHTLSDTQSSTRGIGAAREWIATRMREAAVPREGVPPLQVAFDRHRIAADGKRVTRDVEVVNVVATLPGIDPVAAKRHYYVLAHYDSRASDPLDATSDAPGANDDGSGVAVLLELARILAPRRLDATVVLVATAGEEQGLLGARAHAKAAVAANVDIRGVLSFDIVGDPRMPSGPARADAIRLFSEGLPFDPKDATALRMLGAESDSPSRELARHIATLADWHTTPVRPMLVFRPDRFLRGGDHTPFNELGIAAVRFTELGENYDRQHQDVRTEGERAFGDVPEFVDPQYVAGVTRLGATAILHLASAPSAPTNARIVAKELGHPTQLRWIRAPEADVAGYEVVWRATTEGTWQHAQDVGNVDTITLDAHKDEHFFGVRSYDSDGHRSQVTFCGVER
jgi:hypothetical protein